MPDRPLVTFALFAYNHERFIKEAVEGAFSQTYSPLEVILSDDSSTDRTFSAIQDLATAYRGSHRVIINRNSQNLGIGAHVNAVNRLASGDLVVFAGGDDVSLPERTGATVEPFLASDSAGLLSVSCDFQGIDEGGKPTNFFLAPWRAPEGQARERKMAVLEGFVQSLRPLSPGCVHTCRRRLLTQPSPLPANLVNEDAALTFRALLFGRLGDVPGAYVKYRVHQANQSRMAPGERVAPRFMAETERRLWKSYRDARVLYEALREDVLAAGEGIPGVSELDRARLVAQIERRIKILATALEQLGAPASKRLSVFLSLLCQRAPMTMLRASLLRVLSAESAYTARLLRLRLLRKL